jgi:Oxidoreductase family, NAD-binding Rossmann fold
MVPISRRRFLKNSMVSVAGLSALSYARASDSPHDKVVLAFIGIGSTVPGSVGGRGRQLIPPFSSFKDVDIAYLCDIDESFFPYGQKLLSAAQRREARVEKDLRRVLEDKSVDAVVVATPDHWHALATIWACQADKHVYVEKPASHNLNEGRRMVEAARRYHRVVQLGTQSRSSASLARAAELVRSGKLGKIPHGPGSAVRGLILVTKRTRPCPRESITISGSARRPSGPLTSIVFITAGTGCGITAPVSWATTGFMHSTAFAGFWI